MRGEVPVAGTSAAVVGRPYPQNGQGAETEKLDEGHRTEESHHKTRRTAGQHRGDVRSADPAVSPVGPLPQFAGELEAADQQRQSRGRDVPDSGIEQTRTK